jgi:hypothetical protein
MANPSAPIAAAFEAFHRPQHGMGLLGQRQQLQLHCQVHTKLYSKGSVEKQERRYAPCAIPLSPEGDSFSRRTL